VHLGNDELWLVDPPLPLILVVELAAGPPTRVDPRAHLPVNDELIEANRRLVRQLVTRTQLPFRPIGRIGQHDLHHVHHPWPVCLQAAAVGKLRHQHGGRLGQPPLHMWAELHVGVEREQAVCLVPNVEGEEGVHVLHDER
jgi:hypothetical protein